MGFEWNELWSQGLLVVGPVVGGVALVLYIAGQRLADGVSALALPADGKFLKGFFYTGALVTIWLSCYYYYGVLASAGA